jgi:hypothetical protein
MDLKVSLKSENGLFNFLKKKLKKLFLAPGYNLSYSTVVFIVKLIISPIRTIFTHIFIRQKFVSA